MRVAPFSFLKAPGGPSFNPLSIAGCALWYNAGICTTTTGDEVTSLPDQSGNARDATIAGAPVQTAADAGYNGIGTIFRDDTTDTIEAPDLGLTTNPFTLVFVGDGPAAAYNFMMRINAVDLRAQGGTWKTSADGGVTLLVSAAVDTTLPTVLVAIVNGASSKLYVSALTPTTGDTGTQPDMTSLGMFIGDTAAPGGGGNVTFAQALVYDTALSPSDVAYLLNGFGTLAGITIGA